MKKIKILSLIIILFIISILFIKGLKKSQTFDDILFLKLGSNTYPENTNINLIETANEDTLIQKKIAPGTKGEFSILLNAKKNIDYKIIFEDLNEKPANLKFIAMNNENIIIEADTLEEMSNYLSGNISENEKIEFKIKWYWKFENIENKNTTDSQDTNDGQKIKQYQFKVYTVAQES